MNILIVEDERVAARRLERLLSEILEDKDHAITCIELLDRAMDYIEHNKLDLVFLDLNLNGADGFEILKKTAAGAFQTIIVSANTDRAIEAYEFGVLDFIPKPFEKQRLIKALKRVEGVREESSSGAGVLVIKSRGKLDMVEVADVLYIKGAGDYSEVNLKNGEMVLHSKSLESLMLILPPTFVRVHKSYIVNFPELKGFHLYGAGKYDCELTGGIKIPVSRSRFRELSSNFEGNSNISS